MFRCIIYCLISTFLVGYSIGFSVVNNGPASVARQLVHQTKWASVGSLPINSKILGFPMANVISIDDSTKNGESNGKIHFMLTDLDFTGLDWHASNKVTFLLTNEKNKICPHKGLDPKEPICSQTIISGKVIKLDKTESNYQESLDAFIKRHPAARFWIHIPGHAFHLCELEIENIFVMCDYGGPKTVSPEQYYAV